MAAERARFEALLRYYEDGAMSVTMKDASKFYAQLDAKRDAVLAAFDAALAARPEAQGPEAAQANKREHPVLYRFRRPDLLIELRAARGTLEIERIIKAIDAASLTDTAWPAQDLADRIATSTKEGA